MQFLSINPSIHYFEKFTEFAEEFKLASDDLIFTEAIIYNNYIKKLDLPCHVMIRDDYEVGEPSEEAIDKMLLDLDKIDYKRMIAVGGGSIMDTAKALVIKDAYPLAHLLDKKEPNTSDKVLINIPTTCGTGAEISSGGIYFIKSTGLKTAILGAGVNYAVLVPELIVELPFRIFFLSAMDALSHAVEGQLYKEGVSNEFGLSFSRAAITTIVDCMSELAISGAECRKKLCRKFIIASCMANISLTAAGANLVHALAYPPAEKFHMAHGESVYQFLLPVLKLYQRECPNEPRLIELAEMIAPYLEKAGYKCDGTNNFDQLQAMLESIYPLRTMTEVGMTAEDLEPFTKNIIETKQRLLTKALMPVNAEQVEAMYRERM